MTSFYTEKELKELGLKSYGKNVCISHLCSIYEAEHISIGNNVRIDDFCILSGNINIGSNIHISAYVALYGSGGIVLDDYTGISPRTTVFSAMDDFSGDFLIGPIHPSNYRNVKYGPVIIKNYAQIGAHCVIFPNITIAEGCVVGTMSLVNKDLQEWSIYIGQPAIFLKKRKRNLLNFVK